MIWLSQHAAEIILYVSALALLTSALYYQKGSR